MKDSAPLLSESRAARNGNACAPDRFVLAGRSVRLDRRVNAVRGDIADVALAGTLFAPHYALPTMHACIAAHTLIHYAPSRSAPAVSQLLRGEGFAVVDISGSWAWGYCLHDHYVGYMPLDALGAPVVATHIINQRATLIFVNADGRSPLAGTYSMGARLWGQVVGDFLRTEAGFIHLGHVRSADTDDTDAVALAERLLGTPYYWGGRGFDGIDCSGLVQLTLGLAGVAAPRDADQQQATLGAELAPGEALQRGDLVFLPNHVGMMVNGTRLIHASGHAMAVVIEPLAEVVARYAADRGPFTPIAKRIAP